MSGHPRSPADVDTHRREDGSLPEGVFHLLIADGDLAERAFRRRVTVCGAVVQPADLPPSWFGDEIGDPRYCAECVGEAMRWSADAGDPASTVSGVAAVRSTEPATSRG